MKVLRCAYWGSELSVDLQLQLCKAMAAQGWIMNVYQLFGRWRFYRETRYSGSRLDALRKPSRPPVTATAT